MGSSFLDVSFQLKMGRYGSKKSWKSLPDEPTPQNGNRQVHGPSISVGGSKTSNKAAFSMDITMYLPFIVLYCTVREGPTLSQSPFIALGYVSLQKTTTVHSNSNFK